MTLVLYFFFQATLCSMKGCMRAMVAQLKSESEDLQQVSTHGSTANPLCHSVRAAQLIEF